MFEINLFTEKRKAQYQAKYHSRIEKWGNYCCVPLDIPRFHSPKFVRWFFEKAIPIKQLKSVNGFTNYGNSSFDSVDVNITEDVGQASKMWDENIQSDFLKLFPEIYNDIMKYFPFQHLEKITCWSSNRAVSWHRDHGKFTDNPSSFRIIIHDENPSQTLYVAEHRPDTFLDVSNKFLIPRLDDTNSFVWNNLRLQHGSEFVPKYRKILLLFSHYHLDLDRYDDLMERSVRKYKDNILVSNYKITDFVNI